MKHYNLYVRINTTHSPNYSEYGIIHGLLVCSIFPFKKRALMQYIFTMGGTPSGYHHWSSDRDTWFLVGSSSIFLLFYPCFPFPGMYMLLKTSVMKSEWSVNKWYPLVLPIISTSWQCKYLLISNPGWNFFFVTFVATFTIQISERHQGPQCLALSKQHSTFWIAYYACDTITRMYCTCVAQYNDR